MITQFFIRNFKSFDKETIDLGPIAVVVGANAAGKSNFIDAFRFVQDSLRDSVSVAVDRRLGPRGIRCRRRYDRLTEFALTIEPQEKEEEFDIFVEYLRERDLTNPDSARYVVDSYEYSFRFEHSGGRISITSEEFEASLRDSDGKRVEDRPSFNRRVNVITEHPAYRGPSFEIPRSLHDSLYLRSSFSTASSRLASRISGWTFYDIDADEARAPRIAHSVLRLAEHAENLPLLLERLLDSDNAASYRRGKRIQSLMQSMVPGFEAWIAEKTYDGRTAFRIKERGTRSPFPPELVSDGTVILLSLLSALLAPSATGDTIFIEEPERGLHPQLMEGLVDLMRTVSNQSQIIVTTHSPDLVRHLRPEEVYMVDKVDRASKIVRASSVEQVEMFLENFSLDELWMHGYLQAGLAI